MSGNENHGLRRTWRRIPVFIASTFRDMDYERDVITRQIIPAVNQRIGERYSGVTVYPVDLRSGVETDDRLDPETRQLSILQTCVAEVGRCRLLLALVGNKYGWMPPGNEAFSVVSALESRKHDRGGDDVPDSAGAQCDSPESAPPDFQLRIGAFTDGA